MEGRQEGMRPSGWKGFIIVLMIPILLIARGEAQEKKGGASKGFGFTGSRSPIEITSDSVEGDQKQNRVTFKGNVIAKQEEATLYANTIVVYYDSEMKKIKEIIAIGNVRIVHLERRASGQKATFCQNENKVVLEGEAVVREGDNVVRGERVVYLVDEERSYVEGGKGGRVSTTITPSTREERKK